VIGRNGAGKSTLLKVLSQITAPTRGRVVLNGRVSSLLEVGTGFHPELTGRENVFLNGTILGMTKAEIRRKFDEIVAFAEVERFLDTPVKRYSSGMYVRLAFAVAAHLEPEILIVDEVLAVGDATFQKKCLGKMKEVGVSGRTVLFVSHNMAAVTALCGRALLMDGGRLASDGEVETVVAEFLGSAKDESSLRANFDFRDLPRDGRFEGAIRLVALEVRDRDGNATTSFGLYEPISIALTFESDIDHPNFVAGFNLRTQTGIVLLNSTSDDSGEEYPIEPGTIRVRCTLTPNHLRPGRYWLGVGCHAGVTQDYVEEAVMLDIVPNRHHSKSSLYHLPGLIHFDFPWSREQPVGDLV
jgi:lipopolysaccharide transport system ATP-binding protein